MQKLDFTFTPEFCYILGFLWGDGFLVDNSKRYSYKVAFEIERSDFEEIIPTFQKYASWNFYFRKRKNRQETGCGQIANKEFVRFLKDYNYNSKSKDASILKVIPDDLKRYWLRGLVDADGNVCFKNQSTGDGKYKTCGLSLYGPLDQDWGSIQDVFTSLGIKTKIQKRIRDNGKSSDISCFNRNDVLKIKSFLYPTFDFGLTRKFKIFEEIESYNLLMKKDLPL